MQTNILNSKAQKPMVSKPRFSKPKFYKLTLEQKHKKCSETLRIIYETILINEAHIDLLNRYNEMLSWLDMLPFISSDMKKIADQYHMHLSLAKINLKEHNLLPSLRTGDREPKEDFLNNAIFLDNIRSAYNVGSILRTTEALRIGTVYFAKKTPFIDNKKVIKTAMGSAEIIPCIKKDDLKNLPRPFIALDTANDAIDIYDFIFPKQFTLILGNEEYGISDEVLKEINYALEIPMLGMKNSINVACAYGIAASQIRRQKKFYGK